MKPFDLEVFREAVAAGRIDWRKHVLQKLAERGVPQQAARQVLLTGERIREYSDDKPFPSALFLGYVAGKPLHVVAACDQTRRQAFVITAYEPSAEIFEADYRTKRK
jgi:Ser/Thr protein kinase RdoA (MazF antagonist)